MENKARYISFTGLKKYRQCPYSFYRHYNELKELPSEAMLKGRGQHSEVEAYINGLSAGENLSLKLKRFIDFILKDSSGFETESKIELKYFPELTLIGYVDFYSIDETETKVSIVDWKSNKGFEDEEQLKIYCVGMLEKYPFLEVFDVYFYFRGQDFYTHQTFLRDEIESYEIALKEELKAIIEVDEFKTNAGDHCKWCSYADICPELKKFRVVEIKSLEEAEELLKKIEVLNAVIKKTEKLIQEFMEKNSIDTIVAGDKKACLVPSVSFKKLKAYEKDKIYYSNIKAKLSGSEEPVMIEEDKIKETKIKTRLVHKTKGTIYVVNTTKGYKLIYEDGRQLRGSKLHETMEDAEKELLEVWAKKRDYSIVEPEQENVSEKPEEKKEPEETKETASKKEKVETPEVTIQDPINPTDTMTIPPKKTKETQEPLELPQGCVWCGCNPCRCNNVPDFKYMGQVKKMYIEGLGKSHEDFEKFKKQIALKTGFDKNTVRVYKAIEDHVKKMMALMK